MFQKRKENQRLHVPWSIRMENLCISSNNKKIAHLKSKFPFKQIFSQNSLPHQKKLEGEYRACHACWMPLSVLHPDFFLVYQILYVSVLNPKHGRMEGEVVQTSPDSSIFSAVILLLFESIFLSEVYSYSISFSFYVK